MKRQENSKHAIHTDVSQAPSALAPTLPPPVTNPDERINCAALCIALHRWQPCASCRSAKMPQRPSLIVLSSDGGGSHVSRPRDQLKRLATATKGAKALGSSRSASSLPSFGVLPGTIFDTQLRCLQAEISNCEEIVEGQRLAFAELSDFRKRATASTDSASTTNTSSSDIA